MKTFEVLAVGTPLMDLLVQISDDYLDTIEGQKYGTEIISYPGMIKLIEKSGSTPLRAAGGSAANAIKALAALGHKSAITGKVGTDSIGEQVIEDLQDKEVYPLLHFSQTATAQVASLITPDGKRTMRCFLGASQEMSAKDLDFKHFKSAKHVHIEGYTLLTENLTEQAMKLAKKAGCTVSFDLGSFEIVQDKKQKILDLLDNYVDIVFANEEESSALISSNANHACAKLSELCLISVVMIGEKGAFVGQNGTAFHCPVDSVTPIDTTGAGDLFAGGFLHGFLHEMSLMKCAQIGSLTARAIVQVVGAELNTDQWQSVKHQIAQVE